MMQAKTSASSAPIVHNNGRHHPSADDVDAGRWSGSIMGKSTLGMAEDLLVLGRLGREHEHSALGQDQSIFMSRDAAHGWDYQLRPQI